MASVESALSQVRNIIVTYYVTKVQEKIYKVNGTGLVNENKKTYDKLKNFAFFRKLSDRSKQRTPIRHD